MFSAFRFKRILLRDGGVWNTDVLSSPLTGFTLTNITTRAGEGNQKKVYCSCDSASERFSSFREFYLKSLSVPNTSRTELSFVARVSRMCEFHSSLQFGPDAFRRRRTRGVNTRSLDLINQPVGECHQNIVPMSASTIVRQATAHSHVISTNRGRQGKITRDNGSETEEWLFHGGRAK